MRVKPGYGCDAASGRVSDSRARPAADDTQALHAWRSKGQDLDSILGDMDSSHRQAMRRRSGP